MSDSNNVSPAKKSNSPISMEAVLKRCSNDPKFVATVLKRFSTTAGGEVKKIEAALAESDAETVRRIAHSLKSMTAFVAADSASQMARELEDLGRDNQLDAAITLVESLRQEVERVNTWIAQDSATSDNPRTSQTA